MNDAGATACSWDRAGMWRLGVTPCVSDKAGMLSTGGIVQVGQKASGTEWDVHSICGKEDTEALCRWHSAGTKSAGADPC